MPNNFRQAHEAVNTRANRMVDGMLDLTHDVLLSRNAGQKMVQMCTDKLFDALGKEQLHSNDR